VISEETSAISLVYGGEMVRELDGPRLREILREILSGGRLERMATPGELLPKLPEAGARPASGSRSEA
jgi:hypothetical protein